MKQTFSGESGKLVQRTGGYGRAPERGGQRHAGTPGEVCLPGDPVDCPLSEMRRPQPFQVEVKAQQMIPKSRLSSVATPADAEVRQKLAQGWLRSSGKVKHTVPDVLVQAGGNS